VDSLPQEEVKNILPELGSDDDGEPDWLDAHSMK
jgi:hypothetical protein